MHSNQSSNFWQVEINDIANFNRGAGIPPLLQSFSQKNHSASPRIGGISRAIAGIYRILESVTSVRGDVNLNPRTRSFPLLQETIRLVEAEAERARRRMTVKEQKVL